MTPNKMKNKSNQTDSETTYILESADKDIKTLITIVYIQYFCLKM